MSGRTNRTPNEIAQVLKRAEKMAIDGTPISLVLHRLKISTSLYYRYKNNKERGKKSSD